MAPERPNRDLRDRATVEDAALVVGGLACFTVAAITTPLHSRHVGELVLGLVVVGVVGVAVLGGGAAALATAVMGALSFDFFHVEPIRLLHGRTLAELLALMVAAAVAGGTIRSRRTARRRRVVRRVEAGGLARIADLITHGALPAEVLFACERELVALLAVDACAFEAGEGTGGVPGFELPVLHEGRRIGAFRLVGNPRVRVSVEHRLVAVAITELAGAALVPDRRATDGSG